MAGGGVRSASDFEHWHKIDLHRHLEGSLRFETVRDLARNGDIPLPKDRQALSREISMHPADERGAESFLSEFHPIREVFQSEAIVQRAAHEAVADAASDGVRYLELHATPSALSAATGARYGAMLDRVWEGITRAADEHEIEARIVVSVNRHEGVAAAREALEAAVDRADLGVVGLGLAGDERAALGREFVDVFAEAREAGLGISVHAGEWAGPESVRFALQKLGADRIAHGVRVMEDEDTALLARDRRVPILVCLSSNVDSGVVDRPEAHPLPAMIQAGLQVTLSTDVPSLSGITLSGEYRLAVEALDLSAESIKGMILAAAQAAFLSDSERRKLGDGLQRSLGLASGV